eukprot:TRINITY_DN3489_c0_g1_i5.p2 TRINITY_DN3489_c0_g1~~TRINITY_DN3489_c0_g1_i5.p2  ORF type:complete len:352 (+),score=79.16 TRINITY_DN3489_c0_g1_i5:648-1703(+)
MGGFDGTSNVLAGKIFDIAVRGTHAHSFVVAFKGMHDLDSTLLLNKITGEEMDFLETVMKYKNLLASAEITHEGELAAFIAYALAFPAGFLALVDTYNTLNSGVPNFLITALALIEFGYEPIGIRLDSGDLAYLSIKSREQFEQAAEQFCVPEIAEYNIVASNDIEEKTLNSLNQQGHSIDVYGIGTNLVTCKGCPALGCVFKLVQIGDEPCLKLSSNVVKVSIPGKKDIYRLYIGDQGHPILDIMVTEGSQEPKIGEQIYCRHPLIETKRVMVKPTNVVKLNELVWDGKLVYDLPTLDEIRARVKEQIETLRPDHKRSLFPTPYKVSVSGELYELFHKLWLKESPIDVLK